MKTTKLIVLGLALARLNSVQAQETDVFIERLPAPPDDVLIEPPAHDLVAADAQSIKALASPVGSTKKRVQYAQNIVSGMPGGTPASVINFHSSTRAPKVLVIPKNAGDAKDIEEMEEDLGVMAHILDKAVNDDSKTARAMGIAVMANMSGPGGAQNLYIEGHGAIFLLNVNFPLQPPAKTETAEQKDNASDEWEAARRELAAPSRPGADTFTMLEERFGGENPWNVRVRSAEYDAEKVEQLKKDLITALKNAAHIRKLKSDETVTLVVSGAEAGVMTKAFTGAAGGFGAVKSERMVVKKPAATEGKRPTTAAQLILRARKADCEAFQSGKLDGEAFRKKVSVLLN